MSQEREGAGDYFAYLLRLWRETGGETARWRASLQDPHSGEKLGFAHLDDLVAFLRGRTGLAPLAENLMKKDECVEHQSVLDNITHSKKGGEK